MVLVVKLSDGLVVVFLVFFVALSWWSQIVVCLVVLLVVFLVVLVVVFLVVVVVVFPIYVDLGDLFSCNFMVVFLRF